MQTELFEVDPLSDNRKLYARAAEALGAGALVGIPTETVYGLAGAGKGHSAKKLFSHATGLSTIKP